MLLFELHYDGSQFAIFPWFPHVLLELTSFVMEDRRKLITQMLKAMVLGVALMGMIEDVRHKSRVRAD